MKLWSIQEDTFQSSRLKSQETVYTIGNGYFGTRGSFEEGYRNDSPATLLFGVFDRIDIGKEELANAPDWLPIKLFVNGKRFQMDKGAVRSYARALDMHRGVLSRTVHWESPDGARVEIKSERFASLANPHLGVIRYSVTAEPQALPERALHIALHATFNRAVGNNNLMHWDTVDQGHEADVLWFHTITRQSAVELVQTMSLSARSNNVQQQFIDSDIAPGIYLSGDLAVGETLIVDKLVMMYTSRDTSTPRAVALQQHRALLDEHMEYDVLLAKHEAAWNEYWQVSDIIIEGDDEAQRAIRYNLYQLRISASASDSRYSIAAKGLTGFGYRGHIFHDTEIFMLPYFTYVHPDIARLLLLYRYRLLPAARAKARHNGFEGAQFPWESTLDGNEATPDAIIHPESHELITVLNGHIELHITASIAYATWQYWQVSGDDDFMRNYGAEILISTALFWASRAEYHEDSEHSERHEKRQDYQITNVIGPDEWHEHVNNNAYTNYMARWNIQSALDALAWLRDRYTDKAEELMKRFDLNSTRLNHWRIVAATIRIPRDEKTGVIEQFDGFFGLEPLDQDEYEGRRVSYQGILGVLGVQKHRIVKQADVLMLLTLRNEDFDLGMKRANWDYYYPITDHDYGSSLTPALHVILACELGLVEKAYDLFMKGAFVDLRDQRGNAKEGIHAACAGAVWQALTLGFAGLRLHEHGYSTTPCWPDGWTRLAFKCWHKGKLLSIDLRRPETVGEAQVQLPTP